ncbi:PREDICTED: CMRF35-like molecule 1 [Chrysochloris asiatica]|uniref:CMRF35-like molecule 1 n=1 Tax=Chrysochloris asiatica TaxID=185453 RepID=A0A9B0WUX0_CHRAS|nr:PREDICTED: CMRF35-like molecule 1 [Chrysochloris asiatica]
MDLYFSGCSTLQGPSAVRGPKGGSLTVQCQYGPGYQTYIKWWCQGAEWSSCKIVVKTTGSEQEVKNGHASIRDNHKNRIFTVTMENLKEDDEDTYWYGIERIGVDLGEKVKVSIDPAPTIPEETTSFPPINSHLSDSRYKTMLLSIILPLIFAVFLLLLVAASLLAWRMMKQQKKAAETSPEQDLERRVLGTTLGEEDWKGWTLEDIFYANLTLHHTATSQASSKKKVSAKFTPTAQDQEKEVEYITMAPLPKEEIFYATLSLDNSDQELTYSNIDHLNTHFPMVSHEEPTEYSIITKS